MHIRYLVLVATVHSYITRKMLFFTVIRYQIMLSCWQLKNNDRPTFSTLVKQLERHYSDVLESDTFIPSLPCYDQLTEHTYINWKPEY